MLSDSIPSIGSNNGKSLSDCYNKSGNFDTKFAKCWSSQEESNYMYRNKYVTSSKSMPHRNRGMARFRISRSLNFDSTTHSASSDNSSFEGEKHLSRSAKIMRALNLNNSPYYGKTKIKKALNFNSTPSPKRFTRKVKSVKKATSLSFNTSASNLSKVLNYDESPMDSPSGSIVFTSPESMDENQNETPSQRRFKAHTSLSYSTPNPKCNVESPLSTSFSPLLRSGLKKKIDNIIYIGTPNLQSLKYEKSSSARTPRNLLGDFHDEEIDRPCTPENIIEIVPESTSAIKRSHKKERLRMSGNRFSVSNTSKSNLRSHSIAGIWSPDVVSDYSVSQLSSNNAGSTRDKSEFQYSKKKCKNRTRASHCSSDGNASDTGSIFDYTEERNNLSKESAVSDELMEHDSLNESYDLALAQDEDLLENEHENTSRDILDVTTETENNDSFSAEIQELNLSNQKVSFEGNDAEGDGRSVTPEVVQAAALSPEAAVTPENRVNFLQHVMQDSIKKSHRKIKDDNRKRLFTPQVLHQRLETMTPGKPLFSASEIEQHHCITDDKPLIDKDDEEDQAVDRALTPDKMNSSRLLLAQYSSVKKSHRKDKHTKMLSNYKRRQENFNKDMDIGNTGKEKTSNTEGSSDKSPASGTSDSTSSSSAKESYGESSSSEVYQCEDSPRDKLSPSKRKSPQTSPDFEIFTPKRDSKLEECNSPNEQFQIFTPLKKRKSLMSPISKGFVFVYQVPSGNDDISEEAEAELSRCITPVSSYHREYVELSTNGSHEEPCRDLNALELSPQGDSGRSTPHNMSTIGLYSNLDSIKKSHKKNKRRPKIQRGSLFPMADTAKKDEEKDLSNLPASSTSMDDLTSENNMDQEEDEDADKTSSSISSNEAIANPEVGNNDARDPSISGTDNNSTLKTPPACLRAIQYIKLLQSTSIKRSHKKERDRKKIELALAQHNLSNDGSIFGDNVGDGDGDGNGDEDQQTPSEFADISCSDN